MVKSLDYFQGDLSKGFLIDKERIFHWYRYFLYAHAIGAPIALLSGVFQFSFQTSKIHRQIGKVYILSVLLLAIPGALLMSFYAIGGLVSTVNFLAMTVLWGYFTYKAYEQIKTGNISAHRTFMTRSFILTNSAILIRVLSYFNHNYPIVEIETGYILIAILSWVPALFIFEMLIMAKKRNVS